MYTVIYSKSPYLLARMATDLQMEGWKYFEDNSDPFSHLGKYKTSKKEDMDIWYGMINFFTRGSRQIGDKAITLTSRNYLEVLGAILNSKK